MPLNSRFTPPLLAAALIVAFAGASLRADDIGPDAAKRLLSEGRIKPLTEILAAVNTRVPGEMIEVELELEGGQYIYEFKLLRPDGKVQEVEADASTGTIVKIEEDD
jgi:uncharacterized membrane protein YkoI